MIDNDFINACFTGDIDYVKKQYKRWDIALWNGNIGVGLYHASRANRKEVINLLLEYIKELKNNQDDYYQNYDKIISFGLEGACVGNQIELAKSFLDLGIDKFGIFHCIIIAKHNNLTDVINLFKERNLMKDWKD